MSLVVLSPVGQYFLKIQLSNFIFIAAVWSCVAKTFSFLILYHISVVPRV